MPFDEQAFSWIRTKDQQYRRTVQDDGKHQYVSSGWRDIYIDCTLCDYIEYVKGSKRR